MKSGAEGALLRLEMLRRPLFLPFDGFHLGREAVAYRVFRYDAGKHEIEQIIRPAGFGSSAGHFESAEWVAADDCARDGAIDVEVSNHEFRAHAFDVLRTARIEAARECERCVVGNLDRLSPRSFAWITARTGPKISSCARRAFGSTPVKIAGAT